MADGQALGENVARALRMLHHLHNYRCSIQPCQAKVARMETTAIAVREICSTVDEGTGMEMEAEEKEKENENGAAQRPSSSANHDGNIK